MAFSSVPFPSPVETVIRKASRRRMLVEAAEQFAVALSITLGGFALVLLLGTEILDWYWLPVFLFVGLVISAVRVRALALTEYRLAQVVDQRLSLHDALSTAHHLLTTQPLPEGSAVRYQLQQAEEAARTVDPASLFPFRAQKPWAIAGALVAACFGLFALRYLVTSSLSLHPPIVSLRIAPVVERIKEALGAQKEKSSDSAALHDPYQLNPAQSNGSQQNDNRSPANEPTDAKAGTEGAGDGTEQKTQASSDPAKQGLQANNENRAGDGNASQATGQEQSSTPPKPGANAPKSSDGKTPSSNNQNGSPSLMDRMKDTLSSLASKMQPNSSPQSSSASSEKSTDEKKGGQQSASASKDQQNSRQQNGDGQKSDQSQSAEGQAQGQTSEKAQASQGHTSDQSAQKGSDAHSGVGRQDGEKDIKTAEQLKAMGKLAEIIGKRSASVTGEMSVETPSSKEQLKTNYSQRVGQHSDSGGEINRNEVPLMYQQYVREYMEQVRKQDKDNQ